ncbi:MAG: response regulator transcription factor [Chloroflexi bacterium]|nr:response regulator transcription factor [Chloroflexota bacterium]
MIRLLLVQTVRLVGELMATSLKAEPDIQIVGSMDRASATLTKLQQIPCDIVLLDVNLPDSSAHQLLREWVQHQLPGKLLMTGLVNSESAILRCLEDGASGYILEDETWSEFVNKIRAVARDEFIISPSMTTALITRIAELRQVHNIFSKLGVGNRHYAATYARQMLGEEFLKSDQP